MSEKYQIADLPRDLWILAAKIRGLGEIFSMCTGDPPLSSVGLKGLSHILEDYADQLDEIRQACETSEVICAATS